MERKSFCAVLFVIVLSLLSVIEQTQVEASSGSPAHNHTAGAKASPPGEMSYDWVAIFSPEGITTIALWDYFIKQHLSGEPFTWRDLYEAKAKLSLTHVHQALLCGTHLESPDKSPPPRHSELKATYGGFELPFEWMPEDRCKIEVKDDVALQGAHRETPGPVQYDVIVSAADPRLLRLSWLTAPPRPAEGPEPPACTFVIGQDGQPHPGIRTFPYMASGYEVIPWSLHFLLNWPSVILSMIGAFLALVGCVNWRGYCWGLGIDSKTLPGFRSVSDYLGHSLEVLVSPALLFMSVGGILYSVLPTLAFYHPIWLRVYFGLVILELVGCFIPCPEQKCLWLLRIVAYGASLLPPLVIFLAASAYSTLRPLLPVIVSVSVIYLGLIMTCLLEAYVHGRCKAAFVCLKPLTELDFFICENQSRKPVIIIRNFEDCILGLLPYSKEIGIFPSRNLRIMLKRRDRARL